MSSVTLTKRIKLINIWTHSPAFWNKLFWFLENKNFKKLFVLSFLFWVLRLHYRVCRLFSKKVKNLHCDMDKFGQKLTAVTFLKLKKRRTPANGINKIDTFTKIHLFQRCPNSFTFYNVFMQTVIFRVD